MQAPQQAQRGQRSVCEQDCRQGKQHHRQLPPEEAGLRCCLRCPRKSRLPALPSSVAFLGSRLSRCAAPCLPPLLRLTPAINNQGTQQRASPVRPGRAASSAQGRQPPGAPQTRGGTAPAVEGVGRSTHEQSGQQIGQLAAGFGTRLCSCRRGPGTGQGQGDAGGRGATCTALRWPLTSDTPREGSFSPHSAGAAAPGSTAARTGTGGGAWMPSAAALAAWAPSSDSSTARGRRASWGGFAAAAAASTPSPAPAAAPGARSSARAGPGNASSRCRSCRRRKHGGRARQERQDAP